MNNKGYSLKSCPFCGSEPKLKQHHNRYKEWWLVHCPVCHVSQTLPKEGRAFDFAYEAVDAWNAVRSNVDPASREFGDIVGCAVRYALGRRTYITGAVAEFVLRLIPELNSTVLQTICTDIIKADEYGGLGDEKIDVPIWRSLHRVCAEELRKRGGDAEHCVCCGDVIPEGRQVCPRCEGGETK